MIDDHIDNLIKWFHKGKPYSLGYRDEERKTYNTVTFPIETLRLYELAQLGAWAEEYLKTIEISLEDSKMDVAIGTKCLAVLGALEELRAKRIEMKIDKICECGHYEKSHFCELDSWGSCRPGFPCASECMEFKEKE
jgi:hypothetical protein